MQAQDFVLPDFYTSLRCLLLCIWFIFF